MVKFNYGNIVIPQNTETISAIKNLLKTDPPLQFLSTGLTSIDVRMPNSIESFGLQFQISNIGSSGIIQIQTHNGGAVIVRIHPRHTGILTSNGSNWVAFIGPPYCIGSNGKILS